MGYMLLLPHGYDEATMLSPLDYPSFRYDFIGPLVPPIQSPLGWAEDVLATMDTQTNDPPVITRDELRAGVEALTEWIETTEAALKRPQTSQDPQPD
jgi:hypothetical protein